MDASVTDPLTSLVLILFSLGVWPALARVIQYGQVAYIPPWFSVKQPQTDSSILNINFGTIQNPGKASIPLRAKRVGK